MCVCRCILQQTQTLAPFFPTPLFFSCLESRRVFHTRFIGCAGYFVVSNSSGSRALRERASPCGAQVETPVLAQRGEARASCGCAVAEVGRRSAILEWNRASHSSPMFVSHVSTHPSSSARAFPRCRVWVRAQEPPTVRALLSAHGRSPCVNGLFLVSSFAHPAFIHATLAQPLGVLARIAGLELGISAVSVRGRRLCARGGSTGLRPLPPLQGEPGALRPNAPSSLP